MKRLVTFVLLLSSLALLSSQATSDTSAMTPNSGAQQAQAETTQNTNNAGAADLATNGSTSAQEKTSAEQATTAQSDAAPQSADSTSVSQNQSATDATDASKETSSAETVQAVNGADKSAQSESAETAQNQNTESDTPSTDDTTTAEPSRRPLDMSVPETALVKKYRTQYTTDYGKKWLLAVMENGKPYRGFIKAKIAEMNMPECLEFLPVIESSFRVNAASKSGAIGLWQFMKNSISPYNIRVNEWMDERRDPWLSTIAALKKLKENYDVLGDWYLALAAYNSGLGAINRSIRTNKSKDYWYLSEKKLLKSETIQYVPKFLAIADILTNPEFYGIELPEYDTTAHEDYITIPTKRNMDIGVIAEEIGLENGTIQFLNPALLYGVTPPGVEYNLRIPSAYKDQVTTLIADKSKMLIKYHRYKIRTGDTLYALALHYDVSVDMIQQANPGLKPQTLQIGKTVLIPAFKDVTPYAGKKADESIVYDGSYTVQQGETLWSISLKYDVQVEDLADANKMQVDAILRIGSVLKVPIMR